MERRVSLITLGVFDLERARAFYEHLGWVGQTTQETVFIEAQGVVLSLWARDELASDAQVDDGETAPLAASGFGGIVLAHNVRAKDEVDAIIEAASAAGATVTRPPADTFYGGYAACFRDPEGHLWEIAFNPGFEFADDGSIVLPDFSASPDAGSS